MKYTHLFIQENKESSMESESDKDAMPAVNNQPSEWVLLGRT